MSDTYAGQGALFVLCSYEKHSVLRLKPTKPSYSQCPLLYRTLRHHSRHIFYTCFVSSGMARKDHLKKICMQRSIAHIIFLEYLTSSFPAKFYTQNVAQIYSHSFRITYVSHHTAEYLIQHALRTARIHSQRTQCSQRSIFLYFDCSEFATRTNQH